MKKCLLLPLAWLAMHAHAANYYVSSGTGDDNRTAFQARNPATPWRTIDKLNAYFPNLQPGDSILFKRGETFYGQLDISQSGISGSPIVVSAYGTGAKPILSGFTTVNDWIDLGAGIWESTRSISTLPTLEMVTVNNTAYAMGRYPNADATNKGYLTIDAHNGSTSITSNNLPSSPDWDGARLVLRTQHYILDTSLITSHSGTTIRYSTPPTSDPIDGYGFFIENHPRTLDQFGEWYYNRTTKKMRMFFGAKTPDLADVKVATVDTVVRCFNHNYITFDNLNIQGANENGINIYSGRSVRVQNCNILFCGNAGIDGGTDDVSNTIENNLIADALNYGIDMRSAAENLIIRNNTIKRIGLFPGMGGFGTQSRTGIVNNSSQYHRIESNRVDSVGYIGIRFGGDYTVVKNNIVSNFTLTLDDGSGIYTANHAGAERFGRKVLNNMVYNGIGAKEGTTSQTFQQSSGIYVDDNSSGIEIAGNSAWNCGKVGMFLHNSFKINAHGNTFYNNTSQMLLLHDNEDYPELRSITLKKNIGFAKTADQDVAYFYTLQDDIASFGNIDSNYYARPVDDDTTIVSIIGVYVAGAQVKTKYTLTTWKPEYGKDAASKKSPKTFPITINPDDSIRFEYNITNTSRTVGLDGSYMDVEKNIYTSSIVLQPYSSVVLMRTATPSTATPKAPSVSLTSPAANAGYKALASVTIAASASDADGIISKVDFYNGTTLLGTATASPYSFNWKNVAAGNYTLTAKATDNSGLVTASAEVAITVTAPLASTTPKAPSITLNPVSNTSKIAPATIQLSATATDADGSISKVDFYNGTTLLATVTASPYVFTWQNVAAGTYSITAKATDNTGLSKTSAAISVTVTAPKPPTVVMTSPTTASHYTESATIELAADANDVDGTIQKVEFYNGATLLATKTAAPFTYSLQNVATGDYIFTAKATDNSGLTATSSAVSLKVTDLVTMQLTPNPVTTTLYITINGLKKNNKNLKISILSASGTVLKTIRASASDNVIEVDVSSLQPQLYTLQATSGFITLSGQFVKL